MKRFSKTSFLIVGVIIFLWVVMELIFYEIAREAEKEYEKDLMKQARFYNADMQNTRNWNLKLGGVYVHEKNIEINLYAEDNSLQTPEGKLVRVNPGWMTRMLSENFKEDRLHYAIVSNNPINPANLAEGFYASALRQMQAQKSKEPLYKMDLENKRLSYIEPIYTEKNCMQCHMEQKYEIGSLRGGMVVEIDASFALDRTEKLWQNFYFVSGLTTLFALLAIYLILKLNRQKHFYFNENIKLNRALHQKVQKLNQILEVSGHGYWEWNIQTDEFLVDEKCLSILELQRDDLVGTSKDWFERIKLEDKKTVVPVIEKSIQNRERYVVECRLRHAKGHYIWTQGSGGITSFDAKGNPEKLSGTLQDITKRKLLERQEKNNAIYLNTLFEKNPNIIIVTDGKYIRKANDAFFKLFDEYDSLDSFLQEHNCICDFFEKSESDECITGEPKVWIEQVLSSSEPVAKIKYKNRLLCYAVHAKKVNDNGSLKIIVTFNDITETYGLKKRFEELSILDELTQLHNRRHFNMVFEEEANRAKREKHNFCFMIMDIDNFKLYNDNYGHDEGDRVLVRFAKELKEITKRSNEFCFRLGGEEFGIVFTPLSKEAAVAFAQNICKRTYDLNIEHLYNLESKRFTVSIGIAYVEAGDEINLKQLYKQADQALYLAKERGRNRVEVFED